MARTIIFKSNETAPQIIGVAERRYIPPKHPTTLSKFVYDTLDRTSTIPSILLHTFIPISEKVAMARQSSRRHSPPPRRSSPSPRRLSPSLHQSTTLSRRRRDAEEIPSVDPGSALQRPPATRRQPHVCPTADSEDSHTEHEPDNNDLNDDSDDEVPRSAQMRLSGHQKRQATAQLTREIARIPKRREVMVIEDDGDEETPNPSNNKRASRYRCLPDVLNL